MRLRLDSPWSRIDPRSVIGVVRPAGQEAVQRLAAKGLVVWTSGEGKDEGVMLVRRPADGKPPPYPRGSGLSA